jgi:hypothetical protein
VLASFGVALIIGIAIGLVTGSHWGIAGVFLLLLFVRARAVPDANSTLGRRCSGGEGDRQNIHLRPGY